MFAGLAVSAARLSGWRWPGVSPAPQVVPFVAVGLYLAVGLYYTTRVAPTGDEPEYLLMAQSLWRDRDLAVADNWERAEWREYVPGMPLPEGPLGIDDRARPARPAGLPAAIAAVYALAGRTGVTALLALAAALAATLSLQLARSAVSRAEAHALPALAALGPPLLFYSFHVYPEGLSALALAGSLQLLPLSFGMVVLRLM